ncbi:MAG: metal ABC transporter permease, partial [bacterium]|nr:metal ABC transporter permease [bacterium]
MASYRFIFYSVVTLALFWIGHLSRPEISNEFLGSMELWRDPILAGIFCGLGCSLLGNFILLNRIVFMSLAIAQGAGLGIFIVFWACALLGYHIDHSSLPFLAGLAFAGLTAMGFAWLRHLKNISEESLIGLLYILA